MLLDKHENMNKKEYTKTPMGRALYLLNRYKRSDKKYNRGESDLTARWVVENIFSKSCAHCGETDWTKLGCNRLDNSKPHTKDNVEPCCWKCNHTLESIRESNTIDQISPIDGEIVKTWQSAMDCERNGYNSAAVCRCCNGGHFDKSRNKWHKCQTYKGFIFRRWKR